MESQLKANIKIVSYGTSQSLVTTILKISSARIHMTDHCWSAISVLYLVYMHGIYHVICFMLARDVSVHDCWTNKYACLTVIFEPPCLVNMYLYS